MNRFLESATRHLKVLPQSFPSSALARSLCLGMVLLANQAMASHIYRMVDARCTDSNHPVKYFPDGEGNLVEGAGPKVCANHVTVEVKMRGDYVPGTEFSWNWLVDGQVNQNLPPVESFLYFDGARRFGVAFTTIPSTTAMEGLLPERGVQRSPFWINTNGWGFFVNSDGTWHMNLEMNAGRDAPCGINSTEGPNGCLFEDNYNAIGTYRGWHRVPEPAPIGLLSLALVGMGIRGRLRSRDASGSNPANLQKMSRNLK